MGCFCAFLLLDTLGFGARVRVRLEISLGGGLGAYRAFAIPCLLYVFSSLWSAGRFSQGLLIYRGEKWERWSESTFFPHYSVLLKAPGAIKPSHLLTSQVLGNRRA